MLIAYPLETTESYADGTPSSLAPILGATYHRQRTVKQFGTQFCYGDAPWERVEDLDWSVDSADMPSYPDVYQGQNGTYYAVCKSSYD